MKRHARRTGLTTVQIKPHIARMLVRFVKQGISKSELINEALRQYLIERETEEVRRRLVPYAQAKGVYTDEDVERFLNE